MMSCVTRVTFLPIYDQAAARLEALHEHAHRDLQRVTL
jgi:hypothetical protein